MRKKIVVTGGAGFIGSHFVQKLLAENYDVYVIDDFNDFYDPEVKEQNIKEFSENPNFHLHRLDITDSAKVKNIINDVKPHIIVHLAARAGVRPSLENPELYANVNIMGTLALLEAAKETGIEQFIFGSSSSVYGNSPNIPFSEDDPCSHMISPYAVTKRSGELLCELYAKNENIPITCLRFFTVYGPRQRPDLAIHSFMKKISSGEPVPMFGDGTTARDYTYIEDIIEGIYATLQHPQKFAVINLGNSHPINLKGMIQEIEKALGKNAVISQQPMQKGDVERTFANISKAKDLLNWEPKTSFAQGIEKMAQWYNETYA
jgi:UDP-glucuronate 4-epimerase